MKLKVWLVLSLLILCGVAGAQAYQQCACTCTSSCYTPCPLNPFGQTCITTGICAGSPACGQYQAAIGSGSPNLLASSLASFTTVTKPQSCASPDQKKLSPEPGANPLR